MGKRKFDKIAKIENKNNRKVTFCKRKKGVIKKLIELSILCDQKVAAFIFDENT